jgi:hypothetical protein
MSVIRAQRGTSGRRAEPAVSHISGLDDEPQRGPARSELPERRWYRCSAMFARLHSVLRRTKELDAPKRPMLLEWESSRVEA